MEKIHRDHHSQDMPADITSQDEMTAMFTEVFDRFQECTTIKHKDFYPTPHLLAKIIEITNKFETYALALNGSSKSKHEKKIHACVDHIDVQNSENIDNESVLVAFVKQIVNTLLLLSNSKKLPVNLVQNVIQAFVSHVKDVCVHWMNVRDADLKMNPKSEVVESYQAHDANKVKLDTEKDQTMEWKLSITGKKPKNIKKLPMTSSTQVGIGCQNEWTAMFTEVLRRFQDFITLKYKNFYPSSYVLYKFVEITNKFEKYFLNLNGGENLKSVEIEINQCIDHFEVLITENNEKEIVLVDFVKQIVKTVLLLANSKTLPLSMVQYVIHSFLSVVNQVGAYWIQIQYTHPARDSQTKSKIKQHKTQESSNDKIKKAQNRIANYMNRKLMALHEMTIDESLSSNQAFDNQVRSFLDALRCYSELTESYSKKSWIMTQTMFLELDTSPNTKLFPNTVRNKSFLKLVETVQGFITNNHGSVVPPQSVYDKVVTLIKSLEVFLEDKNNVKSSSICSERVGTFSIEISKNMEDMRRTQPSEQDEITSQDDCTKLFTEVLNKFQDFAIVKYKDFYPCPHIHYKINEISNKFEKYSLSVNGDQKSSLEREILQCTEIFDVSNTENKAKEIVLVDFVKQTVKTLLLLVKSKSIPFRNVQKTIHSFVSVVNKVCSHWIQVRSSQANYAKMKYVDGQVQNNTSPRDSQIESTTSRAKVSKTNKKELESLKTQMVLTKLSGIHELITDKSLILNQALDNRVRSLLEALGIYSEFCENHLKESFTNARTKFLELDVSHKRLALTDLNRLFLKLVEEFQGFIVNTHGYEIPPKHVHTKVIALIRALENCLKTSNMMCNSRSQNSKDTAQTSNQIYSDAECLLQVTKVRNFLKQSYKRDIPCEITCSRMVKFIDALESYVSYCTNGSPTQWREVEIKLNKVHSYDPKKMKPRDFGLLQHFQKVKTTILNSKGLILSNQIKGDLKALLKTLKSVLDEADIQRGVAIESSLNVNRGENVPDKIDFNAECRKCVTKVRNFVENTFWKILPCEMSREIIAEFITALQSYVLYVKNGLPNQAMDAKNELSKVLYRDSKKLKNCNLHLVQHLQKITTVILESKGKRPSNDVRDGLNALINALSKLVPNDKREKEVTTHTSFTKPGATSSHYVQPMSINCKNTLPSPSSSNYVQSIATTSKNLLSGATNSHAASTSYAQTIATYINNQQPVTANTSFIQQSTKKSTTTNERSNDNYENTKRDMYLINLLEEVRLATENYSRTPCPTFQEEIADSIRELQKWYASWGKSSKEMVNANIKLGECRATFEPKNIVDHKEITLKAKQITPKVKQITPKAKQITPKVKEITPKVKEISSKVKEITTNDTVNLDFVIERYNLQSNKTGKTIKDENKKLSDKQTEKEEFKLIDSLNPYTVRHPPVQKINYCEKLVMTNHVVNKTINRYAFDEISLTKQQIKFLNSAIENIPSEPNSKSVQYSKNILAELKSMAALDDSAVRDIDSLIKSLECIFTGDEKSVNENVIQKTDDCFMNGNATYLQRCEREFDADAYQTCKHNTMIGDLLKFEDNVRKLIEIEIAEEVEKKSGEIMNDSIDYDHNCSDDDGEWSDISDEESEYVNNFTITKEDNRLVVELHDANQACDTNSPFPVIVTLADDETIELTNKLLIEYNAFMLLLDETEDKVKLEFPTVSAFLLFVKDNQSLVERLDLVSKGFSSLPRQVPYNTNGLDVKCIHFLQSEERMTEQVNNLLSVFEVCKRSNIAEKSLLRDLKVALKNIYPNHVLHVFGSRATGQALPDSDYDIFCDVTGNEYTQGINHTHQAKCVEKVAAALKKSSVQHGTVFTTILSLTKTRVPIVKMFHKPTQMNCDISFKDGTSMENTHLLNMYLSLDSRVAWVLTAVKLWAHYNHIQGSSYFTSHGLTWLLLFYLMKVGVIPPVMQVQSSTIPKIINNWDVSFQTPKTWSSHNTSSSVQLLKEFFTWLAHMDFSSYCLCTFTGELIAKRSMSNIDWMKNYKNGVFKNYAQRLQMQRHRSRWNLSSYDMIEMNGNSGLCVQDPFEHSKNVTKAVKEAKFVNFVRLSKETCRLLDGNRTIQS
ncbi:hypothetical protein WDU94_006845 [Cyamophila willieti]